jgi:septum formation protein
MTAPYTQIYLASQSPRRREILKQIGVNFEVLLLSSSAHLGISVDETTFKDESPTDYVQRICIAKARAGWEALIMHKLPPFPVLAADTTVTLEGHILGKPNNNQHAAEMLHLLSGRHHQVLTAVAMICNDQFETRLSVTDITFAKLDEERIQRYLATGEAHDKAGAYGIQGHAGAFVQRLEGSYSGVVGLPLFETVELLTQFGYPPQ